MKIFVMLVIAIALAAPLARGGEPDRFAEADRCVAARPDARALERGARALEDAVRGAPSDYDATWRLARVEFYRGLYGPEGERVARYESAVLWARKAVALDAKRAEGQVWLGLGLGALGEAKGIRASLANLGDMRRALERANEIDPSVEGAAPPRILGRLYFKLPWVAGGSNRKATEYLRAAMKLDPAMPLNYTFLAEVLIDDGANAEARALLEKLIAMPAPARWVQEHAEAVEEARRLLRGLE